MTKCDHSTRIAILSHAEAQLAAVHGLADLFHVANQMQQERTQQLSPFEVEILTEISGSETFHAVILPPSLGNQNNVPGLHLWLRQQHRNGALICSVCAGAFLLAASGLLEERSATTHWALADAFTEQFPDIRLEIDKLMIDDGDIMMAGGLMAWVDMGLRLVDRFMGASVMLATARFLLVDPGEREQRFYSSFAPRLSHGDSAILTAQHWLQAHYQDNVTVPQMAQKARLEGRTFIRRFNAATGYNPSDYLQQLRVSKARELMEMTQNSVDLIAADVGYKDPTAFRRVFQKIVGLTPREYRRRFSIEIMTR